MKKISCYFLFGFLTLASAGQNRPWTNLVTPRMRVIIDNDFGGDPDGLFQLAHSLLSPSIEIRGIIGSHLRAGDGFDSSRVQADNAARKAREVLQRIDPTSRIPVIAGSNQAMINDSTPVSSAGVNLIIREALRTDSQLPLYVVCGAGLTEIASALLKEPSIASRLTLVWIGGSEYPGTALPPPNFSTTEYNTAIDIAAVKTVFNRSSVAIWQVPRNAYRQAIFSYAELLLKVRPRGKIGEYLCGQLEQIMKITARFRLNLGEVYVLGDSPLVLLTALQSSFEADPASSDYILVARPKINDLGNYDPSRSSGTIRVYTRLDLRLMFEDFIAKLRLIAP